MDIQRLRVKVFADAPPDLDVTPILSIFARWRDDRDHPARWIDLADYAHVPNGPLALLVGEQGNLGYDLEDGRPGLVWRNKTDLDGDAADRLSAAITRGLGLFADLAADAEFPTEVAIRPERLLIEFVDRVDVPNDDESDAALAPVVRDVAERLFGTGTYRLTRQADAGRPYGFEVEAESAPALTKLLARLNGRAAPTPQRQERKMNLRRVAPHEAARLVDEDGYAYIDVRSVGEFDAGHPTGAFNIPIMIAGPSGALLGNRNFLQVIEANFPKDARIVVGCKAGGRSLRAAQIMMQAGYTDVIDNYAGYDGGPSPSGGIEPGWSRVDLPVSTEAEAGRSYDDLEG